MPMELRLPKEDSGNAEADIERWTWDMMSDEEDVGGVRAQVESESSRLTEIRREDDICIYLPL